MRRPPVSTRTATLFPSTTLFRSPIVPLALFRDRTVVACSALLFICFFNFIALSVLVPLRLQLVAAYSTADAALYLLPLTLAIPTAAFTSGRLMQRTGDRKSTRLNSSH